MISPKKTFTVLLISLGLMMQAVRINAQPPPAGAVSTGLTSTTDTTQKPGGTTATPAKTGLVTIPKVIAIKPVYLDTSQAQNAAADNLDVNNSNKTVAVYPGNIVKFIISNPKAFLNSRPTDNSKVVLYVNGVEMKGITSDWMSSITRLQVAAGEAPALNDSSAAIFISLRRNETTRAAWRFFYANTDKFYQNFANLNASIGWEGMSELQKKEGTPYITIIHYRKSIFYSWIVISLFFLASAIYICGFTDALRDGGRGGAFSLSLSQLMFWTILTIGAFIYTLVLTDIATSFNTSILLLLGISAGTTGFAYTIDSNFAKNHPNAPQKQHKNFLRDILTDGTGYSVQRIQTFAWNLVLGTYFIIYTIENKSMPEFSDTLLFLAGVSSASYLTAKGPENTNATRPVGAAGAVGNPQP